ncbi:aminoglycoside 6-adenylyltransferase [Paenibacillus sediminis]|uniref:Aminoglycoside 6-adenylyltransferase n=1 Tax=Paenibacillus sediminis TaxID=664909 RepID=A0ABS4H1B4_9BACL|nr:aminoglycoside 6-adenylyltransferase [Paenibacillus sediminis]MBP1936261.1 aminoglycoside 6-adenylyltransferase [Paenibacillus sediminis]
MRHESEVICQIANWGESERDVIALILTSSRANPHAYVDELSDYDVEVVIHDHSSLGLFDDWLNQFGEIITSFKDENILDKGLKSYTKLVQFEDGLRIDFQIRPITEWLAKNKESLYPPYLDLGYRVLLDKDGFTKDLKPPSYTSYVTKPPTRDEYMAQITSFWWDITYVAKSLKRDELYFAKYMLDHVIRYSFLLKMIEWYIGVRHCWTVNPNKYGRWFKKYIDEETWLEIEHTFAGASIEENWTAMYKTMWLFRRLAKHVGHELGFEYPDDLDMRVTGYVEKLHNA